VQRGPADACMLEIGAQEVGFGIVNVGHHPLDQRLHVSRVRGPAQARRPAERPGAVDRLGYHARREGVGMEVGSDHRVAYQARRR
jgi:hypothetical protein